MIVSVLMSSYNGEKYIKEQIESILNQKIEGFDIKLLVRDDGSKDSTLEILESYKKKGSLDYYKGKNLKPARSFIDLLKTCPQSDYYAFCDQDDVWNQDKIFRAVTIIKQNESKDLPFLYCSNVQNVDKNLRPLKEENNRKLEFTDFAHSLVYSLAPGCTFVINNEARKKVLEYNIDKNYVIIHDWLVHKIVALFGKVYFDDQPSMKYRQHENNEIGAQIGIKAQIKRFKRFLFARDNTRSNSALALLKTFEKEIAEENKELLEEIAQYRNNQKLKKKLLKDKRFKTGTINDLYFKTLVRLNKV